MNNNGNGKEHNFPPLLFWLPFPTEVPPVNKESPGRKWSMPVLCRLQAGKTAHGEERWSFDVMFYNHETKDFRDQDTLDATDQVDMWSPIPPFGFPE